MIELFTLSMGGILTGLESLDGDDMTRKCLASSADADRVKGSVATQLHSGHIRKTRDPPSV